jgi:predicted TIM-barrel fold metal-dependent hydrolase
MQEQTLISADDHLIEPPTIWIDRLQVGVEMRHHIGVDKILWECDYPHSDTSYPNSAKVVAENLRDCTLDEIAPITHGNAERVFNL